MWTLNSHQSSGRNRWRGYGLWYGLLIALMLASAPRALAQSELDSDGDGLTDAEELAGFTVSVYTVDPVSGQTTRTTRTFFTDPFNPDTDGDGISDFDEVMTYARQAEADGSVPSIGLGPIAGRANRRVLGPGVSIDSLASDDVRRTGAGFATAVRAKPVWGVRTAADRADTDGDGVLDPFDPAPQFNPVDFGLPLDADQTGFLDFDLNKDGILETNLALDYSELIIERIFFVDFSNDGTLTDGFDLGGQDPADVGLADPLTGSCLSYRVRPGGDGVLDTCFALTDTGFNFGGEDCAFQGDGDCDDGRPGAVTALCPPGTDEDDCAGVVGPGEPDGCLFARDGECDEERFGGTGVCPAGSDTTDCAPFARQVIEFPGLCGGFSLFGMVSLTVLSMLGMRAAWRRPAARR